MTARIYSPPVNAVGEPPDFAAFIKMPDGFSPGGPHDKAIEEWNLRLAEWCKANSKTPNDDAVGEIVQEPVADGYAQYMVLQTKPLALIHLPHWDAYQFRWADHWTVKDIRAMIVSERKMREIFGRKASG